MGHDFVRIGKFGKRDAFYISFNFHDLEKKYGGVSLIHGHRGITIVQIVTLIITNILKDGFYLIEPDMNNFNWAWGTDIRGHQLPNHQFVGVYLYHMVSILKQATQYPEDRFFSDQLTECIPFHVKNEKIMNKEEKDNEQVNGQVNGDEEEEEKDSLSSEGSWNKYESSDDDDE